MERCGGVTFVRGYQVQTPSWRPDILNDVSGEVFSLTKYWNSTLYYPELFPSTSFPNHSLLIILAFGTI